MRYIIFYIFLLSVNGYKLLNKLPLMIGTWKLRSTNNKNLNINYTYLTLDINDIVKIKTIKSNGFISIKTSRSGILTLIKNNNKFIRFDILKFFNRINNKDVENDFDINITFTNINKYSYSIFGLETPDNKIETNIIDNKNIFKYNYNINVKQTDNTIYVNDMNTAHYYIFDLITNINKFPIPDSQINSLLFTQLFGFIINYILIRIIAKENEIFTFFN
jgi:hypothetical protein